MMILCSAIVVTPCKFVNFGKSCCRERSTHRCSSSVLSRGTSVRSWSSIIVRKFSGNASGLLRAGVHIVSAVDSVFDVWVGGPPGRHAAVLFAHCSLAPNVWKKSYPSGNGSAAADVTKKRRCVARAPNSAGHVNAVPVSNTVPSATRTFIRYGSLPHVFSISHARSSAMKLVVAPVSTVAMTRRSAMITVALIRLSAKCRFVPLDAVSTLCWPDPGYG